MKHASTGVYVISLETSLERRATFAAMSEKSTLSWEFFPAYRQIEPPLIYNEKRAIERFGRPLSAGEIGTYSSHYKVWERFLASDLDQIIVLEDDVVVDWMLLKELSRYNFGYGRIDFLRLFATHPFAFKLAAYRFCSPHSHLVRCRGLVLGIQAYLITKLGARALLNTGTTIFEPVDWAMARYWRYRVPNYCLFPFPVLERFVPSTIGSGRENAHRSQPIQRIQQFIWRLKNRSERVFFDWLPPGTSPFSGSVDSGASYIERNEGGSNSETAD